MFYVYADGQSIFSPLDDSLAIFSPKVTLELGKSGSFQFSIPKTNEYYSELEQLKTQIVVELDNTEIFRGRVLSITRGFTNIKNVYCEGILSFLVDSVQKATRFNGRAKDLYEKILRRHNAMVDSSKQFSISMGSYGVENATVVIPGKKEENDAYFGSSEYEQAIIESIVDEWQTTYDYINAIFLDYLGGYLVARHDKSSGKNYIDYISNKAYDDKIIRAQTDGSADHEIEFGVNMIDFSEEINAEEMFTVLVPLGDGDEDELTIEGATNKYSNSDIELVTINGKQIGIADRALKAEYGSIVKTHVFDNVNKANTLFTDGVNYLRMKKHVPTTYSIRAIDLHFINHTSAQIEIGDVVKVISTPHNIVRYLLCTKIEYDLANPGNTVYTFGNPEQSLTERYKRDKDKNRKDSDHDKNRSAKGGGGAAGAARDYAIDYAYHGYHEAAEWIEAYGAGAYDALVWYGDYGQGAIKAYEWMDAHGAGAEKTIEWYGRYAYGSALAGMWITDNYASAVNMLDWYGRYAYGSALAGMWITDNYASAVNMLDWYGRYAYGSALAGMWITDNYASAVNMLNWYGRYAYGSTLAGMWITDNYASAVNSLSWYGQYAYGGALAARWITNNYAAAVDSLSWYGKYAYGGTLAARWITNNYAAAVDSLSWYGKYAYGGSLAARWITNNYAAAVKSLNWYNNKAAGAVTAYAWVSAYRATAQELVKWYNDKGDGGFASVTKEVSDHESKIDLIASFKGKGASLELKAFKQDAKDKIVSVIKAVADEVVIDACLKQKGTATFGRTVTFTQQAIMKQGLSVQGADVGFGSGVNLNMGTNTISCGDIKVSSKHTIKIGDAEVITTKTIDDYLADYMKTSDLTQSKIATILKGKHGTIGEYLRLTIGCSHGGQAISLSDYINRHPHNHTHSISFKHTHYLKEGGTTEYVNFSRNTSSNG